MAVLSVPTGFPSSNETTVIRMYGEGDPDLLSEAGEVAVRVLGRAGIASRVVTCHGASNDESCLQPAAPAEFVVSVRDGEPRVDHECGTAVWQPGGGQFLTVAVECTRRIAQRFGVRLAPVVGYTIVHEIGHLLLSPEHTYIGIMRAQPDWRLTFGLQLRFTEDEAARLRAALSDRSADAQAPRH